MPGWSVWANPFDAGELSNTDKYVTCRMNSDVILKGIRTWFVVYNDPVFTDLNCKIYSNEVRSGDNTPVKLLHTSTDSRTKAELHTEAYGIRETYFTFNEVPLQSDTWYNFVINGTGYVPTSNSYLAWRHAYPDPVLSTDYTAAVETINKAPYEIYFITGTY